MRKGRLWCCQVREYEQARTEADFHGQVRIRHVEEGANTPGQVRIDAIVVRVFGGSCKYPSNSKLNFKVSVLAGKEPVAMIPLGGTLWLNYGELRRADYLEVFLSGDSNECSVALWQVWSIAAPIDHPTMPFSSHAVIFRIDISC